MRIKNLRRPALAIAYCVLFLLTMSASTRMGFAATFIVTKVADTNDGICDSDCSLREAIATANNAASSDTISFDTVIFGMPQTIVLGGTQLKILNNGSLTINGAGASNLSVSGNSLSRVLEVAAGAVVNLNGLTITDGRVVPNASGAGVLNGGTLFLTDCTVTNNVAVDANGGGIFNDGNANATHHN